MATTTQIAKARMWAQTHRSGNKTWKVQVGLKADGKADIRSFETESAAQTFRDEWNAKLATGNTNGLADLSALARAEVVAALAKLEAYNATLTEAVDFFLKHARPPRGQITVEEALRGFIEAKQALNRRPAYLRNCYKTFYLPFTRAFPGRQLADITQHEAEKYINSHRQWSASSKASHINYLRTFYTFFIKKGYAKLNPFGTMEKPQAISNKPKTISPENAAKLLQFALDTKHKAECASMALVFFCGVRVEEAGRISWADIDLARGKVKIAPEHAKKGHRRVNDIPENAREWLKLCQKEQGRVAPRDYAQRMKRLRARSDIEYPQNAMRHCFASYHLAHFKNAATTAVLLGHPNPTLLYQTYNEMVTPEAAKQYWDILPTSVRVERAAQAQARLEAADAKAREEAEMQSNCGQAEKIDGKWMPVMTEE